MTEFSNCDTPQPLHLISARARISMAFSLIVGNTSSNLPLCLVGLPSDQTFQHPIWMLDLDAKTMAIGDIPKVLKIKYCQMADLQHDQTCESFLSTFHCKMTLPGLPREGIDISSTHSVCDCRNTHSCTHKCTHSRKIAWTLILCFIWTYLLFF